MALAQKKFREFVFQLLFSKNFLKEDNDLDLDEDEKLIDDQLIEMFMIKFKITKKSVYKALNFVKKMVPYQSEIDQMIQKKSTEYDFKRISLVELNILRLGVFELFFDKGDIENDKPLDHKIVIAECIRICKKYSTTSSITFVNAVLDALIKNNENIPVAAN
jgi:transcription antitermination protein NusB